MNRYIKALRDNTCPDCKRHHMSASMILGRYWINCGFCGTRWEVTKEEFQEHVRIKDTKTYKENHERINNRCK